jgi:SPP1 gp7 family putative phage head morphogenesis protein
MFKKDLLHLFQHGMLGMVRPTLNAEWTFPTEHKLQELKRWLQFKTGQLFLKNYMEDSAQSWVGEYIQQSYQRGLKRSWGDWRRPTQVMTMPGDVGAIFQKGGEAEFMRQSFGGPIPVEKVRLLSTRTYSDLANVTEQMSAQISRTLLDGAVSGLNPRKVAKQLSKLVDMSKGRAYMVAQTETIRSFNEGALDGLENLGAKAVGVMVEWSVSGLGYTEKGYPSPCKKCAPLAGLVLTVDEARGMLPRHPRCRCSFIPANVGEKTAKQVRDAERIRAAIARSASGDTRWIGASKTISSERPVEAS